MSFVILLVTESYSGDETKDHEMGGACSIC